MAVLRSAFFTVCRIFLFLSCCVVSFAATSGTTISAPDPLVAWQDWVLENAPERDCPLIQGTLNQGQANLRQCVWPGQLDLELDSNGGRFQLSYEVFGYNSRLALPGAAGQWPQDVKLNGAPAVVVGKAPMLAAALKPGQYTLEGRFEWARLPPSIRLPAEVGLVNLIVNGQAVKQPKLAADGQLWLRETDRRSGPAEADRLGLKVFRLVEDDIPLSLTTQLLVDVAGSQREVVLGPVLPEQFIPLSLTSDLPARLEANGQLRLQLRPGRWVITLKARHSSNAESITRPEAKAPWPEQEVWSFRARPDLRVVSPSAANGLDPQQTSMPNAWRDAPAWLMKGGEQLTLTVDQRGNADPDANRLSLNRQIWLDHSGKGYTFKDNITGRLSRDWRLATMPPVELGSAEVNGSPQFVTRLNDTEQAGVELRQSNLMLSASARIDGPLRELPVSGWQARFDSVNWNLALPPGWHALYASGADRSNGVWLTKWTMLDCFLLLITVFAAARIVGWKAGLLTFATLLLLWHEASAPTYLWLGLLAGLALLGLAPAGRLKKLVFGYSAAMAVALLIAAVPFLIDQARMGLYPQLEQQGSVARYGDLSELSGSAAADMAYAPVATISESEIFSGSRRTRAPAPKAQKQMLNQKYDANVMIQTGPGLPSWNWRQINLHWSGPVQQAENVQLLLMPPLITRALRFILVMLVLLLLLRLLVHGWKTWQQGKPPPREPTTTHSKAAGASTALLALFLALPFAMPEAQAEYPPEELLKEYSERLQKPPVCLPDCLAIPRMRVAVADEQLSLWLEVHAGAPVVLPLPVDLRQWQPSSILVNGEKATALRRQTNNNSQLQLALPKGLHQVVLHGPLGERKSVPIPLPLAPQKISGKHNGWQLDGLDADGRAQGAIQLSRSSNNKTRQLEPGQLPGFVRVERVLDLGLEWLVTTHVWRASPKGQAILLNIPLLPGESVLTAGVKVKDGQVAVNLPANADFVSWTSAFSQGESTVRSITLAAPTSDAWLESWQLIVGPMLHVEHRGLAPVSHTGTGNEWAPRWRPWPGESVELIITEPQGVQGATTTIDQANLSIQPGRRSSNATLSLTLRSSRGGQYPLTLPAGAALQSVSINGNQHPLRAEGQTLNLPVRPGEQSFELKWQQPDGLSVEFNSPQIDLGQPATNLTVTINPPRDRWLLFTAGPQLGPAILIWSVLIVLVLLSIGLGRITLTPIRWYQWLLLLIGLTQLPAVAAIIVVAWLLLLGKRGNTEYGGSPRLFNLRQLALAALTVVALILLVGAISMGLLGLPDMQVAGNNSSSYALHWYQDRSDGLLPSASIWSVSLWWYRGVMLLWALWLAWRLLNWLRWGWDCFNRDGLWQPTSWRKAKQ